MRLLTMRSYIIFSDDTTFKLLNLAPQTAMHILQSEEVCNWLGLIFTFLFIKSMDSGLLSVKCSLSIQPD